MFQALALWAVVQIRAAVGNRIAFSTLYSIAVFFALFASLYALHGVDLWLASHLGPIASTAVIAFGLAMVALGFGIAARIRSKRKLERAPSPLAGTMATIAAPVAAKLLTKTALSKKHAWGALAVVAVVVVGASVGRLLAKNEDDET